MLTEDVAKIIKPLHVNTGTDHTYGLSGHDKTKLLQKLISDPEARELLGRVGGSQELRDEVVTAMKTFVLYKIYNKNVNVTCGQDRSSRWHKMKKGTVPLPHDDDTLNHNLERTNYISYCQIHYDLLEHPSPISHSWEFMNGKCRPVCYTQSLLHHQPTPRDYVNDSIDESSSDDDSEISDSNDSDG